MSMGLKRDGQLPQGSAKQGRKRDRLKTTPSSPNRDLFFQVPSAITDKQSSRLPRLKCLRQTIRRTTLPSQPLHNSGHTNWNTDAFKVKLCHVNTSCEAQIQTQKPCVVSENIHSHIGRPSRMLWGRVSSSCCSYCWTFLSVCIYH